MATNAAKHMTHLAFAASSSAVTTLDAFDSFDSSGGVSGTRAAMFTAGGRVGGALRNYMNIAAVTSTQL